MSTQSPVRSGTSASVPSPWPGILTLVAVSGALPALWNLSQLGGLHRGAFLTVYFGLNLAVPFGLGYWATFLWKRATPSGVMLLAACAAVTEAAVEALILTHVIIGQQRLVLAPEDYVAWLAVACLFAAGGLHRVRRARAAPGQPSEQDRELSRSDWLAFATRLLQLLGALAAIYPHITHS